MDENLIKRRAALLSKQGVREHLMPSLRSMRRLSSRNEYFGNGYYLKRSALNSEHAAQALELGMYIDNNITPYLLALINGYHMPEMVIPKESTGS